jgi:DNA polymerase I-like protein with 3'-5' exonuclease and polymerase domains
MMAAYQSGDPYLAFAKQSGAIPRDATKETHPHEREKFKTCALGIQYSMGVESLALRINGSVEKAQELIQHHKKVFAKYWEWSEATKRAARARGEMRTVYGWKLNVREETRSGTIGNFPLQATGAEILRLLCCRLIEREIRVCAPVHDAVLIEAALDGIDEAVATCEEVMREVSSTVLGGFPLTTDSKIIRYPDRYMDVRGEQLWGEVCEMMRARNPETWVGKGHDLGLPQPIRPLYCLPTVSVSH